MQIRAKDWLLVPNLLTTARLVLFVIPVYLITLEDPSYRLIILLLLGMGSDILDGYLARKLNQTSDLGRILDPLADKLATVLLAFVLYRHSDFPFWALILIASREVTILVLSTFFVRKSHLVLPSNFLGKLAALSWALVMFAWVLAYTPVKLPVLFIALVLTALSSIVYMIRFFKNLNFRSNQAVG